MKNVGEEEKAHTVTREMPPAVGPAYYYSYPTQPEGM